jgi:diacylglycerol kinase (ATP)
MRRTVLVHNPAAGGGRNRMRLLQAAAEALRERGLTVDLLATVHPGSAGAQVATLDAEIIFACGGDGTIHDVVQGLAFRTDTALGILPLGSANALARHLRLPLDPVRAALAQLDLAPRTVPLGHIRYTTPDGERERYFLVTAGAGADGALIYKLTAANKLRLGRLAYYLLAAQLALTHRFPEFDLTCTPASSAVPRRVVTAMAARVGDLGGAFRPLMRGTRLQDEGLRLAAVTSPARLSLPLWFAMSWMRLQAFNRYAFTGSVQSFTCGAGSGAQVPVQADGDWLGYTPMTVSVVPGALRILAPPEA